MTSPASTRGYSSAKPLHAGELSEVYAAVRDSDGTEVILKIYRGDSAARQLAAAWREFETLRAVAGKGIPKAFELLAEEEDPTLVLERVPGVALGVWLEDGVPDPKAFLRVALQAGEILERVHRARYIHCDLNPWNIMVDPATLETHVIDFGLARRLGSAHRSEAASGGGLCRYLRYIAPEQTGRMNRGSDLRSDLYSLGATLYHALTGKPPFEFHDPLELIHAHLARLPVPPAELRSDLPPVLSDLVMKLLRKEPEERYRNGAVLHADLKLLYEELERTGRLEAGFELAATEAAERPRISRKLYGREREIARLRGLLAAVTDHCSRALLIAGEPGIGKSALVDELRSSVSEVGGYLAIGRFDAYRSVPYAAWESALGSLCQQILIESDERLEHWRSALRSGLGSIARALVEFLPDLAFIVGEVEPVPTLGPVETQARLSLALQRFLAVCGVRGPLVLFLDDLQWIDAESQRLLEDLLCSEPPAGLLVIGAYRPGDAAKSHLLEALLAHLAEWQIETETLTLSALDAEASAAMLAEALERTAADVRDLGQLVERKTGNNPMLMRQFLEHIHDRGMLCYRHGQGWRWNAAEIAAAEIPEGAVGLLTEKILRLDSWARALIEFASCVGDEFDADVLSELGDFERGALEQGLHQLCDAGLIAPCSKGFRFVHARIREAVQSRLPAVARERLHYDMARLLISRTPESQQAPRAVEIVEHLNLGLAYLEEDVRLRAIRLNVAAGTRTLASGAAVTANEYFAVARSLLRDDDWRAERALGFELLLLSADSSRLCRDFDGSIALLDELDGHEPSLMESAQIEVKRIQVFAVTKSPEDCSRYAVSVLRRHGIRWPLHPSPLRARLELRRALWKLRPGRGRELLHKAIRTDPRWLAPVLITGTCGAAMARFDIHLVVLLSCWITDSNLRRGYVARPHFSMLALATWIQVVLGNAAEAQRLAGLAQQWMAELPDPVFRPRFDMQRHAILRPWWTRRKQALAHLDRACERMRENGDLEFAYYARFLQIAYGALAGTSVPEAETAFRELADTVRRSGQRYPEPERCHTVYRMLLSSDETELWRELAVSESSIGAHGDNTEIYIRTFWMLVLCVRGRYPEALGQSDRVQGVLFRIVPFVQVADHTFLRGIALAGVAPEARGRARWSHLRELALCQRRLQRWAKHGPDFVHMQIFLLAEQACLRGDVAGARALYDKAVQRAREQDYLHHAALACERRGRMLAALRRETEAGDSLREAIALYARWGAQPKVDALEAECRALFPG